MTASTPPQTQEMKGNNNNPCSLNFDNSRELNIASNFVLQYYTLLNKAPHLAHMFYSHDSTLIHGSLERAGEPRMEPVVGCKNIKQRLEALNFFNCRVKVRQIDSMSTLNRGILIQVIGELSNNGENMRRFVQTFILAPSSPSADNEVSQASQGQVKKNVNNKNAKLVNNNGATSSGGDDLDAKFYVLNDIFRYQDHPDSDTTTITQEQTQLITHNSVDADVSSNISVHEPRVRNFSDSNSSPPTPNLQQSSRVDGNKFVPVENKELTLLDDTNKRQNDLTKLSNNQISSSTVSVIATGQISGSAVVASITPCVDPSQVQVQTQNQHLKVQKGHQNELQLITSSSSSNRHENPRENLEKFQSQASAQSQVHKNNRMVVPPNNSFGVIAASAPSQSQPKQQFTAVPNEPKTWANRVSRASATTPTSMTPVAVVAPSPSPQQQNHGNQHTNTHHYHHHHSSHHPNLTSSNHTSLNNQSRSGSNSTLSGSAPTVGGGSARHHQHQHRDYQRENRNDHREQREQRERDNREQRDQLHKERQ